MDNKKQLKPSPAPWTRETVNGYAFALDARNAKVVRLPKDPANAALIVAAPELLDACKYALGAIKVDPNYGDAVRVLRRAIAKAKGGQS